METQTWHVGDEMLTPAGMLQLIHGNTDVGCLEEPHAEAIVTRLNNYDTLVKALKKIKARASQSPAYLHPTKEFAADVIKMARAVLDQIGAKEVISS